MIVDQDNHKKALHRISIYKEKLDELTKLVNEQGHEIAEAFTIFINENLTDPHYDCDIKNAVKEITNGLSDIGIFEYSVPGYWLPSSLSC